MILTSYAEFVRSQVSRRDWKILQHPDINLDSEMLAKIWPDFVNLEKRAQKEVSFIKGQLCHFESPGVFDASAGTGATSIALMKNGIDNVVLNELDPELLVQAKRQADEHGVTLTVNIGDWRAIHPDFYGGFDCVTHLGNSLTYLFRKKDRKQALENFYEVLRPGGKLIIDERNYPAILAGNYHHSGEYVYCGKDKVEARPIHTSKSMVVMQYRHKETGQTAHLALHPFKRGQLMAELKRAGFESIDIYADYHQVSSIGDISAEISEPKGTFAGYRNVSCPVKKPVPVQPPEFITYVARKPNSR